MSPAPPAGRVAAGARAVLVIAVLVVVVAALVVRFPDWSIAVAAVFMTVVSVTTLAFQLYAWRTPAASAADGAMEVGDDGLRVVVFLAARHEAGVLRGTLDRMVRLRHSDYAVWVVIDHRDDHETLAIATEFEARHPTRVRVVAYPDVATSSKPIGLNEAMRVLQASGEPWDVVGIADAEDRFHPDLLRTVDHVFRSRRPGVVQGAVQLVNYGGRSGGRASAWWRAANCLEYFKWFSSRLKLQAALRVMPLGGNTVFFSREFIEAVHTRTGTYWDEACLTEDCKIGILASVMGFEVEVFSLPHLATREETPETLPKFVRQRVRWMQGFIQVFAEGSWLELPTLRQRVLAVYVLGFQFFQAFAAVAAPFAVLLAVTHDAPTPVVLLALVPLAVSGWTLVLDLVLLHDFGDAYDPLTRTGRHADRPGNRVGVLDYLGVWLGGYAFQVVLAIAAVGAVYRQLAGVNTWVKTDHSGAYLDEDEPFLEEAAA